MEESFFSFKLSCDELYEALVAYGEGNFVKGVKAVMEENRVLGFREGFDTGKRLGHAEGFRDGLSIGSLPFLTSFLASNPCNLHTTATNSLQGSAEQLVENDKNGDK